MTQIDPFHLIGIAVRTTNQNNQASHDLAELWGRFYKDSIAEKIPNKSSDDVYAVYTDYESDYTGAYTTLIACKVDSLDKIPEGMAGLSIEAGNYLQFTAQGEMPQAIVDTWISIWNKGAELKRKYSADFELYPADSGAERAEIYIAVE